MPIRIQRMFIIFLTFALIGLPGCNMQTVQISIEANLGVLKVNVEMAWEKENEVEGYVLNLFGAEKTISSFANDVHMYVDGENATIYNQNSTITLSIKHEGVLLGAETFSATVSNGQLVPDDPQDVEQWLVGFDSLDRGILEMSASSLSYQPPTEGHYQISSSLKDGSQTLASATVSGFVSGSGGGCKSCVVQ
jgi:hypothetical protein